MNCKVSMTVQKVHYLEEFNARIRFADREKRNPVLNNCELFICKLLLPGEGTHGHDASHGLREMVDDWCFCDGV